MWDTVFVWIYREMFLTKLFPRLIEDIEDWYRVNKIHREIRQLNSSSLFYSFDDLSNNHHIVYKLLLNNSVQNLRLICKYRMQSPIRLTSNDMCDSID